MVLVVEGDPHLRNVLTDFLEFEGIHASAATGLDEALDVLAQGPPDLILTDTLSSSRWGNQTLAPVRQLIEAAPGVPVVLLTAHADAASLDPAREGLAAVVIKPFELEELLACLQASAMRQSDQYLHDQRRHELAKWKSVTQVEVHELLQALDAGFANGQPADRERYHAAVDRFICAVRHVRACLKNQDEYLGDAVGRGNLTG